MVTSQQHYPDGQQSAALPRWSAVSSITQMVTSQQSAALPRWSPVSSITQMVTSQQHYPDGHQYLNSVQCIQASTNSSDNLLESRTHFHFFVLMLTIADNVNGGQSYLPVSPEFKTAPQHEVHLNFDVAPPGVQDDLHNQGCHLFRCTYTTLNVALLIYQYLGTY
ncbi:hypothetical protein M8J75_006140 [Diaphorina citri]|nr:hypothetical protein M8J75_006140 [Diaphorina citri]